MNVLTLFIWYIITNIIVYIISVKLLLVLTGELRNSDCDFHNLDEICYIPFINTSLCIILLPILTILFIIFWIIHKL